MKICETYRKRRFIQISCALLNGSDGGSSERTNNFSVFEQSQTYQNIGSIVIFSCLWFCMAIFVVVVAVVIFCSRSFVRSSIFFFFSPARLLNKRIISLSAIVLCVAQEVQGTFLRCRSVMTEKKEERKKVARVCRDKISLPLCLSHSLALRNFLHFS